MDGRKRTPQSKEILPKPLEVDNTKKNILTITKVKSSNGPIFKIKTAGGTLKVVNDVTIAHNDKSDGPTINKRNKSEHSSIDPNSPAISRNDEKSYQRKDIADLEFTPNEVDQMTGFVDMDFDVLDQIDVMTPTLDVGASVLSKDVSESTSCSNVDVPLDKERDEKHSAVIPSFWGHSVAAQTEVLMKGSYNSLQDDTVQNSESKLTLAECSSTATNVPLVQYFTNKMKANKPKTNPVFKPPLIVLKELFDYQQMQPAYEVEYNLGVVQAWVSVTNHAASGIGSCVKTAKDAAASSLMDQLVGMKYFGNPIGKLPELCQSHDLPFPVYEYVEPFDQNCNDWICCCSVFKYTKIGQGKSKEIAKLFAAYKMWMTLTFTFKFKLWDKKE
ncbi:hypothetical protein Bhyg_00842 [Pseudolycoriella hygida]|uniref:DRBM domain-containing protein n=1 Tax=Pseudolycoriella hygida TaxID=35572 RepID=A0A9Q0S6T6_9DIPT|nr:hypothetical protein Bhyg_00842 [Pseudolycoriella hygida]